MRPITLDKTYNSFDRLRICRRDLSFDLGNKPFPSGPSSQSYQDAKRAIEAAAQAGYFCYDEIFVWANALLEDQKDFPIWLMNRFPLIIFDEMQDTSELQATFLNSVFPRKSDEIIVQRAGDPNQAIFDFGDDESVTTDPFPDETRYLEIPNSYRVGANIATHASPFANRPIGSSGLIGMGPTSLAADSKCKNAIFIFPDETTEGVLDCFARYALDVLGSNLVGKGPVTAIGHVHRDSPEILPGHRHYPKCIGHYWSGYSTKMASKDPNPQTLAQYVRAAQGLIVDGRSFSPAVDKIAFGFIELARRIGDIGNLKRRTRTHRAVIATLESRPETRACYRDSIHKFLIERLCLSKDGWKCLKEQAMVISSALCQGKVDVSKAKDFLAWPQDDPCLGKGASYPLDIGPNVYRVKTENRTVDICLRSIHAVKGQTHLATLVLSTYWKAHSAKQMIPWLLGKKANGKTAGKEDTQRLLLTFVAMTRPSHLLCLAIPRSALGEADVRDNSIEILINRGWRIAELVGGNAHWIN